MKDYTKVVKKLREAHRELAKINERDIFAKGGVGEIILANHLKHNLEVQDKGPDAYDSKGRKYEYKVSIADSFVFHFGVKSKKMTIDEQVWTRFEGVSGTYCAQREGTEIVKLFYVPTERIVPVIVRFFRKRWKGGQMAMTLKSNWLEKNGYRVEKLRGKRRYIASKKVS